MRTIFILLAALVLTACVSQHGNPITQDQIDHIKEGQTTKSELLASFGKPAVISKSSDGTEIISWAYARVGLGAYRNQSITVTLSKDGTVSSYTVSNIGNP